METNHACNNCMESSSFSRSHVRSLLENQLFDSSGNKLLRWLYWDDAASTLMGVPTKKDVGSRRLSVKVVPKDDVATTKDLFVVQVVPEKHEELKHRDGKVSFPRITSFDRITSPLAPLPGLSVIAARLATIQPTPELLQQVPAIAEN